MAEVLGTPISVATGVKEGPVKAADLKQTIPINKFQKTQEHTAPLFQPEGSSAFGQIEDEYSKEPDVQVGPWFPNVSWPKKFGKEMDYEERMYFAQHLREQFSHISATRKLEVNTERTKAIQEAVDRMTIGTEINTKVVIMNK